MTLDAADSELLDAATRTRSAAYAPYSGFKVGAALRLRDGRIMTGVNVENISFGLTVCAERHAIAAAVRDGARPGDVVAMAIAAKGNGPVPPCGACRQVMVEFAEEDARILLRDLGDGSTTALTLADVLPHAFRADSMPKP